MIDQDYNTRETASCDKLHAIRGALTLSDAVTTFASSFSVFYKKPSHAQVSAMPDIHNHDNQRSEWFERHCVERKLQRTHSQTSASLFWSDVSTSKDSRGDPRSDSLSNPLRKTLGWRPKCHVKQTITCWCLLVCSLKISVAMTNRDKILQNVHCMKKKRRNNFNARMKKKRRNNF